MAEIRVSHIFIVLVLLVIVATPILIFVGWLAIPALDIFGLKTPEVTQKTLNKGVEVGLATAAGYTPAKSPSEAMDKFREAIRARKYKFAAVYVTKDYADELERVNTNAAELGEVIDKIRNWGDNKGILSDKSKIALYQVDPFPPTFKVGAAPKIEGNKAYSFYIWEVPKLDNPATNILLDVKSTMDYKMFVHILSRPAFGPKTELIKEGEEWKINIPMTPEWQAEIGYFNDHAKTYSTALTSFWNDINRDRFESKAKFESELFSQLRASK